MCTRRLLSALTGALAALLALAWGSAQAQWTSLSDQQIKAAYVLNFVRYVDWPERSFASADAPLSVCTFGGDAAILAGIGGKVVKGHTVQVRAVTGADEARTCHALFIPDQDARRYVATLRALQQQAVLTIGDADGFVDVGGMVGLVHADNRLQFEVNLGLLQQAQLKASSQLLRLARNVIEAKPR